MIRSVFVPLDGSPFAEHALPWALTIAHRAKASLTVVLVHVPLAAAYAEPYPGMEVPHDQPLKEHEQAYLAAVVERVQQAAPIKVAAVFAEGPVAPTIGSAAQRGGADLVVMTTHGRSAFARFWLGSVADQLIREAPVPLLLVRPAQGKVDLAQEAALRHLLIALDGSPLAEQILEPAVALGSLTQADLTLVRVVEPVPAPAMDFVAPPLNRQGQTLLQRLQEIHDQHVQQATAYLQQQAQALTARSLHVRTRLLEADKPAVAILEAAGSSGQDGIALATHGRSGLGRLFLGSVADKVVRGASVPVLVYRPRK